MTYPITERPSFGQRLIARRRCTTTVARRLRHLWRLAGYPTTAQGLCLLLCMFTARGSELAGVSEEATLHSVTFIDADRGWCVGDFGVILRSDDSGLSWQPLISSTTANLTAIGMFNSQRGLAVGGSYEPHTQIGRGAVMLTDDGGETWKPATSMGLPPLRKLLLGPRGQCVAAGDWSPVHATNLFRSFDGGETWEPIDSSSTGAAIALAGSVDDFLVLSEPGEVLRVRVSGAAQQIIPPGTPWTTLAGEADTRWLSGPRANLVSTDRGTTWQIDSLATQPPAGGDGASGPGGGASSAACMFAGEVWAIDAVGTTIVRHAATGHAEASGRTSEASLREVARLDRDRGWAVGDWGTILVTRDGGRSWRTVRGERRRAAVLAVAHHGHQLPWSLLALESQQHHRRVAIVTGGDQPCCGAETLLVRDAAKLVGPIAQHHWDGSASGIRKLLESAPPAVLVLDHALTAEAKSLWTSAAMELGVRRVFETDRANGQTIHYAAPLPGAGKLAGDVWTDALWLLQPGTLPPDKLQLGTRFDSVADHVAADGLASCVGNDRRYVRQGDNGTSRRHLQILQARSGESTWIESMVHSPAPVSELVVQFEATLPRIAEENRQRLVFKLITASKTRGKHELYRAMLRQAAQRWPDEPLGRLCDLYEQAIGTSEEWQRMLGAESLAAATQSHVAPSTSQAVQWSPFQSGPSAVAVASSSAGDEASRPGMPIAESGVRLASGSEEIAEPPASRASIDPDDFADEPAPAPQLRRITGRAAGSQRSQAVADMAWQSHPAVLLARRTDGDIAAPIQQRVATSAASAGSWAELTHSSVTAEVILAPWAARRPLLDGQLDEAIWTAGQSFPLASGETAQLHMAYDADFVYLAVRGPALTGPRGSSESRRRDTPLDQADRYLIRIDVDGDLLTAYELEFDAAGNTRDSCDGFTHWHPRWFVAIAGDPTNTIAEIAIQRSDLIGPLQQPDRPWNVSLQRRHPGQNLPALTLSRPEQWRRLVFD